MSIEEFWMRISELIKQKNTTQRKLAIQCGFSERRIESLSSGSRLPDAFEITKIAFALGTSVEYLVNGIEQNPYKEKYDNLKSEMEKVIKSN